LSYSHRHGDYTTRRPHGWQKAAARDQPELGFAESQAAAIKHTVTRIEKTIGVVKAYRKLKAVIATKQIANSHAIPLTRAKVPAGRLLNCHANTAANKRNTEKKNPNALKKSQ
jgi:hypothetical protein